MKLRNHNIVYRIEVEGRKARLYVNGAQQPCLIVNEDRGHVTDA
jgi:hypothetical protein